LPPLTQPLESQAVSEAKRYSAVMTYRWIAFVPAVLVVMLSGFVLFLRVTQGFGAVRAPTVEISTLP
jgi:hypothetical protein